VKDTKDIIARTLEKNGVEPHTRQELLNWYDNITHQNYFSNNEKILIQQDGLAMGAPSSGLIAEFFLQNLEDTHLAQISNKHNITAYFRYVDDILVIYDSSHTDIKNIQDDFNMLHPNMMFKAEPESNNQINFLDITIHKTPIKWTASIYKKPTFTDSIIPYTSNHPPQHKHTAIRHLHNRLNTYHLQHNEYKEELDTIHDIMMNNGFPTHAYTPPNLRRPPTTPGQKPGNTTQKWAPFTYIGRETTYITNIFKKADIRITLRTNNTLQNLLMQKAQPLDKYSRSGAYKLTCLECNKVYVGQMVQSFTQRFKEHRNAFKSNRNTSDYAKHALEHLHPFGPIQETMQVLQYQRKGTHLNTIEKFFIYKEFSINTHLNDEFNIIPNRIFEALLKNQ